MKLLLRPSVDGTPHVAVGCLLVDERGNKALLGVLCFREFEWAALRPLIESPARRAEIEIEFQGSTAPMEIPTPERGDWETWGRRR